MIVTESNLVPQIINPLIPSLTPGSIVLLCGDLGAGKTTFVRYVCQQLSITKVSSPSFSLVNVYEGDITVYHLDLYRLVSEDDLYSMDIMRYLDQTEGITMIEWPERLGGLQPENAITITFRYVDETKRDISISR